MKYKKINSYGSRAVSVPSFSGGLNTDNNETLIKDNQLSNAINVWWDGTALSSRPCFVKNADIDLTGYELTGHTVEVYDKLGTRHMLSLCIKTDSNTKMLCVLDISETGSKISATIPNASWSADEYAVYTIYKSAATKLSGGVILLFCKGSNETDINYTYYAEISDVAGSFRVVAKISYDYTPTLYMNGKGNKYSLLPSSGENYAAASTFESLNMLGGKFKMHFHTDGISEKYVFPMGDINTNLDDISVEITKVANVYSNSSSKQQLDSIVFSGFTAATTVEVDGIKEETGLSDNEYISSNSVCFSGTYVHNPYYLQSTHLSTEDSAHIKAYNVFCVVNPIDGYVRFWAPSATLYYYPPESSEVSVSITDIPFPDAGNVASNMTVIMSHIDYENVKKICCMKISAEFGGAGGIYNGSRVFLAGGDAPSLMHWSDLNSPLYFPENNYSYVGQKTQSIMAFGKMSDMLIIFKEREIYCTKYVSGAEMTADDVLSGNVIDVTASAAVFPLYPLHDTIGCDLPHTLQLCNNRLCWATSDGDVYTLVTTYNTSELNVYAISYPINKAITLDSTAFAVDWKGHYCLFCGNNCFCMDYDRYSYKYVSSTQEKNRHFTWWKWEFPYSFDCGMSASGKILLASTGDGIFGDIGDEETSEYDAPQVYFSSKVWDFGNPTQSKKIESIYFEALCGTDIVLKFRSNQGEDIKPPFSVMSLNQANIGLFGETKKFLTPIWRTQKFGFAVEATAPFRLSSVTINYKPTGSVK